MAMCPLADLRTLRDLLVVVLPLSMRAWSEFFGAIGCGSTPSSNRCARGLDARMMPAMFSPVAPPPEKNRVEMDRATCDEGEAARATPPACRPAITNASRPAERRPESFQNTCAWANWPPYVTPRIRTGVAIRCRPGSLEREVSCARTSPSSLSEGRPGS